MVFNVKTNHKSIDRSTQDSTWLFDKKKGLLICSLNGPSLLKHKVEIEMLLRENKIDILALNEAKISETVCDSLIIIEGYNHERYDRNRHRGGVLVYFKGTITYDRILDRELEPNSLETVSIQIKPKCAKPFFIIAWYHPPKHKIDDILNIEKLYKNHDKSNTEVIIMGDSNCDDLPDQDKSSIVAKFRAFYKQYQFKQLIRKATRTTNRSRTLLNHFATNKPNNTASSDSRTIGVSDPDLIFGMCEISGSMHKDPKIINCRNIKHYTPVFYFNVSFHSNNSEIAPPQCPLFTTI